jgi:hypothetical protein
MSKPIFIVRFPYIKDLDREQFEHYYKQVGEQLPDYHVLSLIDSLAERVEFECYNSPHTEIEFEELKNNVMDMVGNIYKHESKTVTGVPTEQS